MTLSLVTPAGAQASDCGYCKREDTSHTYGELGMRKSNEFRGVVGFMFVDSLRFYDDSAFLQRMDER
ncbi:hypothetical protein HDU93_006491, partial [Gonapodya sp. JEL0774]